ncbi:MAG TPA: hypothetical protein VLA37_03685 [Sphingomonadaceae bacterium]|nr:hypothetical protein [Sphingomonadaceae bacterium]
MTARASRRPPWEEPFLTAVRAGHTNVRAAELAGVNRSTPYSLKRRDPEFAVSWLEAVVASGRLPKSKKPARPTAHWRKGFLEALAESSNVKAAAVQANILPQTAYRLRRADTAFRTQWYEALLEGYEHLEMETLHRLRMGTAKDDPKFDIANALRLLALHKETVARERALREDEDEDAILASLDAKIEAMRAREEEAARILIAAAQPDDG